jgi:Na+/phosphate symporter
MNKYINKLTVSEYKTVNSALKSKIYEYEAKLDNGNLTEEEKPKYIELKFITRKIDKIIQEFSK